MTGAILMASGRVPKTVTTLICWFMLTCLFQKNEWAAILVRLRGGLFKYEKSASGFRRVLVSWQFLPSVTEKQRVVC
jgi:hypothetical protein